ncbi:DUF4105 domain-containing protein [Nemorincola caseinilytica]|uniref:DUF4105 domain-containing protein n=1 Tax=Nemorincola caseinilytica TaxID=2054315 RepID=A0ABP8NL56_9BACT
MLQRFLFLLVFVVSSQLYPARCYAVTDPDTSGENYAHLRISLLISGPSKEFWSAFGHGSIRVIDSARNNDEHDKIYNFGVLEPFPESIMHQFLTKRVKASFDSITYSELLQEYAFAGRRLTEYEFILTPQQKKMLIVYLRRKLDYNERYYDYDTFHDNCSTRILDLFRNVFGTAFVPGPSMPPGVKMTFRNVSVNRYCAPYGKYWFGLGLNLLYGRPADKIMQGYDGMFLSTYLQKGMTGATLAGKKICTGEGHDIFSETIDWSPGPNPPHWIAWMIAALVIVCYVFPRSAVPGRIMGGLVLLSISVLGCCILYTWWLDGEPAWTNNLNILWALPTHFLIPFLGRNARRWYACVALALLAVAVLASAMQVQYLPLFEVGPLLLALVWIYSNMYRKNTPGSAAAQ